VCRRPGAWPPPAWQPPTNPRPTGSPPCFRARARWPRGRAVDWAVTPRGPVGRWPAARRTAVWLMLATPVATSLWCGPTYTRLSTDAYRRILGATHPAALGRSGAAVWDELWPALEPRFAQVRAGGPAVLDARGHGARAGDQPRPGARHARRPHGREHAGGREHVHADPAVRLTRGGRQTWSPARAAAAAGVHSARGPLHSGLSSPSPVAPGFA
jgi:hypothetical protein